MTTLKQQIGAAVRFARKSRKLTQEQLAWEAFVAMETVSNVERGATLPTVEVLFKLARVLSLDLAALADTVPAEGEPMTRDRLRLEAAMTEVAQALPDAKLKSLVEIGKVLARGD
jgi:transcriptional regulator with XRE-family HTH domain